MITLVNSPTIVTLCNFFLLFCGLFVFSWGTRLPGRGSWLVWTGILALVAGIGIETGLVLQQSFQTKLWTTGWIWPRDEVGAITVGVLQDRIAIGISLLTSLVSGAFLLNLSFIGSKISRSRVYAALAISTSGVVLSWISITPWLSFAGLVFTILGGFLSLGSGWDSNIESNLAARFLWERAVGFLLSFFGTCILAASRTALMLNRPEGWLANTDQLTSTWIGSTLLVFGIFIQMQPFPFIGWLVIDAELYPPIRVLLNQIYPAWAAFSLMLRLEPQFLNLGLFPGFGWIALISSILLVFSGLFQRQWRVTLGIWLAAGFSLSIALLCFSGPMPAVGMLLGISLGVLTIAGCGSALESPSPPTLANQKRAIWVKVAVFLAACSGTGVIGFVSSTAEIRWIWQAINFPWIVTFFLFALFINSLLGWKLAWNVFRISTVSDIPWMSLLSISIWIVLSFGIVWTGTVTGELFDGLPDRLMSSLFSQLFGIQPLDGNHPPEWISATGLCLGALVLSFASAFWTAGRRDDQWVALSELIPKTSRFLSGGYGIDTIIRRFTHSIIWVGNQSVKFIDRKVWVDWIPFGLFVVTKKVSTTVSNIDLKITAIIEEALRRSVEIPAKILQLVQTGDLRWYLFFSLSCGFALLAHFLKT